MGRDDPTALMPCKTLHDPGASHGPSRPRSALSPGPAPGPALPAAAWPMVTLPPRAVQARPRPLRAGQSRPRPLGAGQSRPRPPQAGQSRRGAVAMATRDAARPGHGFLPPRGPHRELAGGRDRAAGIANPGHCHPRPPPPPQLRAAPPLAKPALNLRLWVLDNIFAPLSFADRTS